MNRLKAGGPTRIVLAITAVLLFCVMTVFFMIGAGDTGLSKLFGGNFFAPENLLAWQIPALRGLEVIPEEIDEPEEHIALPPALPSPAAAPSPVPLYEAQSVPEASPQVKVEVVTLDPSVSDEVKIEILGMEKGAQPVLELGTPGEAPRVLIYQTHNTEAFTMTPANQYKESGEWRTYDNSRNIVAVGEALARELHDKYGFVVLHDTSDHEPPKLSSAYNRSLETMLKYDEQKPGIDLFIDVHRDADTSSGENTDFVEIGGVRVARLMFVVGTGEGKTGEGFKERPDWKENYKLALNITNALNEICPTLARPIRVKTGRYNQHVSNNSLLVEVGHNKNTLEEALEAIPHLAKAIAIATGRA